MDIKALASMLNGREYREEISSEECKVAQKSGLVVIFGASDDLIEFRGAIDEELDAWEGTDFIIATPGTEIPADEDGETFYKAKGFEVVPIEEDSASTKNRFKALWSPEELDCSWLIKTDLPHACFDIMEDGELYCRGIVIDVNSLT